MAFSESLAARARDALARERDIAEKRMFGGLCFLQRGKLLGGVFGDSLLVHLGPDGAEAALAEPHVRTVDMGARPMNGWVVVDPEALDTDRGLAAWLRRSLDFVATIA